jgi:micrococcal nuclease
MKSLLLAAAVILTVACGDNTPPATTQSQASPAASETASTSSTPATTVSTFPGTAIAFVNGPLTAGQGSNATLQVRTDPNTLCSIEVDYKSGPSTAAGLLPKTSDSAGNVSWTWKVGANTTPGSWPITVTCGDASRQTRITVT